MAEDRNGILSPLNGETLNEYLQRLTDAELQNIISNPDLLRSFSRTLLECFRDFERAEDGLENLLSIIERLNNFDRLQRHIRKLKPVRKKLLESLDRSENEIQQISKYCELGRILGFSVDIAGTVGGLWLKESGSPYAKLAFRAATSFGLLGLVSTTLEMTLSKNIFTELMIDIQRDQQLIDPIKGWYQQCDELEEAMRAVFPFDITNDIVREFGSTGEAEFSPATLLSTFLTSIAEQDVSHLRDERLIRNLINFTLYPASQDWCEWILFHRHPVMLDITRIVLQLQSSPSIFTLCQSIPALPIEDQNLGSFPVLGRIGLNMVSIYDAISSLRSSRLPAVASAIRHLREHLASEMAALDRIIEFVRSRRHREQ